MSKSNYSHYCSVCNEKLKIESQYYCSCDLAKNFCYRCFIKHKCGDNTDEKI